MVPVFESFGVAMYVASGCAGLAVAASRLGDEAAMREAWKKMVEAWSDEPQPVRSPYYRRFIEELRTTSLADEVERFAAHHGVGA